MADMKKIKKTTAWLAWLTTLVFVIAVVLPLLVERLAVTNETKTYFFSFELKDQEGKRHVGWFCPGYMPFFDIDFTEYGFEPPAGVDVSARRQKFVDNRDAVKTEDGFVWGDKSILWASFYVFNPKGYNSEGTRLGINRPIPILEQPEITLPGAPWDIKNKATDLFGKWPNYTAKFNNEFFNIDLKMTPTTPGWFKYNDGRPFSAGDFGVGSMNEAAVHVDGTIKHLKSGKVYMVKGTGLIEDALGVPWGLASWGAHDWTSMHFEGGWGGSIWKARDNWQWGYHHGPNNGWLYDPELKKFHRFDRVELINATYETDKDTGAKWPLSAEWRAIGPDATLVVHTKNVSWMPGELKIVGAPSSMKMAHGLHEATAQLVRTDGTVVELKNGEMIGEHYEALFPDYVFFGPLMLVLLTLTWSAYAAAIRRTGGRSIKPPIAWCVLGLFATFVLWFQWYMSPMVQ